LSRPPAARLSGVDFDFGEPDRTPVLRGITLVIAPGEIIALVGPSGCGKTTLVRLLAGLLRPGAGAIEVNGQPPGVAASQGRLGILFQRPVLLPWRDVLGNVSIPGEFGSRASSDISPEEAIRAVGLTDLGHRYPHELSGGMQQRVALARAIVGAPNLLLLDEPFSALDEFARQQMAELLLEVQHRARIGVLLVTHSLAEAVFLADRVFALSPRPCRILHEQQIDLPRPRHRALLDSPQFLHHVACVRKHVF
jgi:NitT/TauT family transport system ATP-binding protein